MAVVSEPTDHRGYLVARLRHARVADAMHHTLLSCPADAPLSDAASLMCSKGVHLIVAIDPVSGAAVGVLSDAALLAAILDREEDRVSLAEVVEPSFETISSDAPLLAAAERMRARGTSHLLVKDASSGKLSGVISTLDVAGVLGAPAEA